MRRSGARRAASSGPGESDALPHWTATSRLPKARTSPRTPRSLRLRRAGRNARLTLAEGIQASLPQSVLFFVRWAGHRDESDELPHAVGRIRIEMMRRAVGDAVCAEAFPIDQIGREFHPEAQVRKRRAQMQC